MFGILLQDFYFNGKKAGNAIIFLRILKKVHAKKRKPVSVPGYHKVFFRGRNTQLLPKLTQVDNVTQNIFYASYPHHKSKKCIAMLKFSWQQMSSVNSEKTLGYRESFLVCAFFIPQLV